MRSDGKFSLRHGHELEHVPIRVLEIDAAAAAPVIELAVCDPPWRAAIAETGAPYVSQNGVKLGIAHVKGVVMALDRIHGIEQKRQRVVDANGCKVGVVVGGIVGQAERIGEK